MTSGRLRMVERSTRAYRDWYTPILRMAFEDPDQSPPVLRWENNVHVELPWPDGRVWLAASSSPTEQKCFVWLCHGENKRSLEYYLKPMVDQVIARLPLGSKVSKFKSGAWTLGREKEWADFEDEEAKKIWLRDTLRDFTGVLRPLLLSYRGDCPPPPLRAPTQSIFRDGPLASWDWMRR